MHSASARAAGPTGWATCVAQPADLLKIPAAVRGASLTTTRIDPGQIDGA